MRRAAEAGGDAAGMSVIIVSHHRPEHLGNCIGAVLEQGPAQVVVVADESARAVAEAHEGVQYLHFEDRNIAAARNCGLAAVTTPLVAFIDDDSVPSAGWLAALAAPFANDQVVAATGYVRFGDTTRWQFKGERIDRFAKVTPLDLEGEIPVLMPPPSNGAILTIGTNCAFRREAVKAAGLFDPAYRYFLDESDLNMRLSKKQTLTAIIPSAQVRHYRAEGPYRRRDGRMTNLFEVGASLKNFLNRYAPAASYRAALAEALAVQDKILLRAMVRGDLEPRDVQIGREQLCCGAAWSFGAFDAAKAATLKKTP